MTHIHKLLWALYGGDKYGRVYYGSLVRDVALVVIAIGVWR